MSRVQRYLGCAVLAGLVAAAFPGHAQQGSSKTGEWRAYSGDTGSTRYAPLDQISRDNVRNLQVAWTWKFDNFGGGTSQTTPIVVNDMMYFTVGQRRTVVAVNPGTGETLWTWRPDEGARFDQAPRKVGRGVAYWTDGKEARIITVTPGFQLIALDAKTGVPVAGFGKGGTVDLFTQLDIVGNIDPLGKIGNSSAPVVANDVIVIGPALTQGGTSPNKENVKADIMGFDVRTGRKLWTFHTIPRKGERGYETWHNGSADYTGNVGVWGPFSADEQLGYVYLATESPTNDGYGGHRPGDNLYSGSIVCLDIKTGKLIWFKQLIRHDIWDYDMPVHPILIDVTVNGKPIKAVVQMGKMAYAWAFDRTNGQPIWPIPDVKVEQTEVPTEWTAPTQPIPSKPAPFDVVGVKEDDLIDFTPALRQEALKAIEGYKLGGPFAPPSLVTATNKGTIVAPGFGGGANWSTGAADPETGYVYVGSVTRPFVAGVVKTEPPDPNRAAYTAGRGGQVPTVQGLPLLKPPYGRITAYNMNTGDIAWQVPNGATTPQNIQAIFTKLGLTNVPPTGIPAGAGLLVTRTLLFGTEGGGGRPLLHAYDKRTGENLAEVTMPGNSSSVPMTYMYQGRQFVALAVGGQPAGQLVAFALPQPGGGAGAGGGRGGRGAGGGGGRGAAPGGAQ